MKSRRTVVAAVALLALLSAGPAAADWDRPEDGVAPSGLSLDDVVLAGQVGLEILQVAL